MLSDFLGEQRSLDVATKPRRDANENENNQQTRFNSRRIFKKIITYENIVS